MSSTQDTIDRHNRFMSLNYPRYPIVMARGEGNRLWDADGKEYLDLFSGFGAGVLGHCHPDLVEAVTQQANTLWHVGNLMHTEPQTLIAEAIATHGFDGRSYFCHSGADANESAIKLARLYGNDGKNGTRDRYKIITTNNSFHGRSFATMMATAQTKVREGFEPWLDGFVHVPFNDLDAIRNTVDDRTVAIMVEPIQGEGGVRVPDDDYLPQLRAICDEHDLLLIVDEVWTGCGRTGQWFAYQHWDVTPDIMTLAKGVGGGLAVGVMCAHKRVADRYDASLHGVRHATTLGGNCLSMAVSAKIFEVIERDQLLLHAIAMERHVKDRLNQFAASHASVKGVRGRGLFLGVELDPSADNVWFNKVGDVVNRCMSEGVLVNGTQDTILRIAPSLTITQQELDQGLDVIERVIAS